MDGDIQTRDSIVYLTTILSKSGLAWVRKLDETTKQSKEVEGRKERESKENRPQQGPFALAIKITSPDFSPIYVLTRGEGMRAVAAIAGPVIHDRVVQGVLVMDSQSAKKVSPPQSQRKQKQSPQENTLLAPFQASPDFNGNSRQLKFKPGFSEEEQQWIDQFFRREADSDETLLSLPSDRTDFDSYARQTILLLRYAQTKRGKEHAQLVSAVVSWVLANCRNKIQQRFKQVQPLLEALILWRPIDVVSAKHIFIPTDSLLPRVLAASGVPESSGTTDQPRTPAMTAFVYSENTAANWAAALAKFTSNIPDFLKEEENKTQDKVDWEILDTMLQDHLLLTHQVFEQIGHLHSFDFAVSDAMGSTRRFADFYSRVNLDAASHENEPDGVKDESKEGEEEELVALPPLPKNSNLDQLPFHSNFLFQRLAGLSAWGTSARLLAENKAFRVSTHLDLRIVELPRQAVVRHEWPAMVKHWGKIGRRKTTEVQQLPDLLPKLADSVTPTNEYGTVHCEAGIMASMLNGRAQEPSTVHSAFDTLRREYTACADPSKPGVAKKSCPACSLLAETINMSPTANITVEVPGRHANWVPWVPPHWLPRDILEAMEIRLINVVLGLLKRHYDLTASNASSPISEEEVAPPVHPRLSKADERLRQLQQTSDEKEKKRREAEEKKRREDEGKKF